MSRRPDRRGDTARRFGASGVETYLTYARLALCALPGWMAVLVVWGIGLGMALPSVERALTVPQLLGPLVLASLPAAVLLHVVWTITDYARVELTLRRDSHAPGVVATYVRTAAFVIRRPLTLVHAGVGWLGFAVVTALYALLAHGHPMYGTGGAILLFFVRQGVALARMAIRFGVLAGQVELGKTRALPPRRPEPAPEAG